MPDTPDILGRASFLSLTAARAREALRRPGKIPRFIRKKFRETFLWNLCYSRLREPKTTVLEESDAIDREITSQLQASGFRMVDYSIDPADFANYLRRASYERFQHYYLGGKASDFQAKALQHYLAAKLLDLNENDVYIDVASAESVAPDIYRSLYGCKTYRQDLGYSQGLNGDRIGGNAVSMPVEDGFATKMALHCSFEHFEKDADIQFLREARRVLRPGGKVCIVPLYLHSVYTIVTDPVALPRQGIEFEPDAVLYCWKGYGNRHGRLYSVPKLVERIKNNLGGLDLTLFVVRSANEAFPPSLSRFAALLERKTL